MKTAVTPFAILLLAPLITLAAESPILTKRSGGGFAPPASIRIETCEVFSDRAVITRQIGLDEAGFEVKEERKISLSSGIDVAVQQAYAERLEEKPNNLCDAPTTTMTLGAGAKSLILFASGACGNPRQERVGPASQKLRELVGLYCPTTHDYGRR